MTKDTLVFLATQLTQMRIDTGKPDWREASDRIRAAQDEIAAELQEQHGVTWTPPGGTAPMVAEAVPVTSNGSPPRLTRPMP